MRCIYFANKNILITFVMNKKNEFFSSIMNEEITNKQAMIAISTYMSIIAIFATCEENITLFIIAIIWFLASMWGCHKNNMLE